MHSSRLLAARFGGWQGGLCPRTETLPEGTWDQAARQEETSYTDPPLRLVDRMTVLYIEMP